MAKIAFCLRAHGENHTDTACSYYNIGLVREQKCQLDEALIKFCKAYKIYQSMVHTNPKVLLKGFAQESRTKYSLLLPKMKAALAL